MNNAGYSGSPLVKKLGIKEGYNIELVGEPEYYFELFDAFPEEVKVNESGEKDLVHIFIKESASLNEHLIHYKGKIKQNGMIWVSWPKKSSKVETDITESIVRDMAIKNGLVDVKVCAVDSIWSGLKLVIPIKNRR